MSRPCLRENSPASAGVGRGNQRGGIHQLHRLDGRDSSDASIGASLGFDGLDADERTSDDDVAEFKRTVEGDLGFSVKQDQIVDDARAGPS